MVDPDDTEIGDQLNIWARDKDAFSSGHVTCALSAFVKARDTLGGDDPPDFHDEVEMGEHYAEPMRLDAAVYQALQRLRSKPSAIAEANAIERMKTAVAYYRGRADGSIKP